MIYSINRIIQTNRGDPVPQSYSVIDLFRIPPSRPPPSYSAIDLFLTSPMHLCHRSFFAEFLQRLTTPNAQPQFHCVIDRFCSLGLRILLHSTTVLVSISQKTQRTTKESHAALCETAVSRSLRNVRGPNAQIGTSWGLIRRTEGPRR
jgi:hypothetical protein